MAMIFSDMFDGCAHRPCGQVACDICVRVSNKAHKKWREEHPIDWEENIKMSRLMGNMMAKKMDERLKEILGW